MRVSAGNGIGMPLMPSVYFGNAAIISGNTSATPKVTKPR